MATIFSKIISGEIPCHKILEDEHHLAFLDIRPIRPGHTLVIPKTEVDYYFDMDDKALSDLMLFSKKAAKMIKSAIECAKIGVMVCGLEVPHVHVHLLPIDSITDMNFSLAKEASSEELTEVASMITS